MYYRTYSVEEYNGGRKELRKPVHVLLKDALIIHLHINRYVLTSFPPLNSIGCST